MGLRGLAACIIILSLALVADAQPRNPRGRVAPRGFVGPLTRGEDGRFILRFDRTPIPQVIQQIARITGGRFIYDSALTGQITIQVPQPVDSDEALQILHTALLMNGYLTVSLEGDVRKIVSVEDFAENAPLIDGAPNSDSGQMVTTLVRLEASDPEKVAAAIRPLIETSGLVIPYPDTNSLILSSTERRLHRLLALVRDLDQAGETELAIFGLRHRTAQELVEMIETALPRSPGQTEAEKVVVSESSNSLIVQATAERMARIRDFITEVDVAAVGEAGLYVVPILHTDPDRLATAIAGLSGDRASGPAGRGQQDALALAEYSLVVHAPSRSLIIQADPATYRRLSEVIDQLDREEPRISVEVILFEVQLEKSFELGLDYIVPLTGSRAPDDLNAAISGETTSASILATAAGIQQEGVVGRFVGNSITLPIVNAAGDVITTIGLPAVHLVARERIAQISVLQRPHLLVINGEDQEIAVGNNIPVPVSAQSDESNPLEVIQTIERYDVGVRIRIGATVGQDGPVRLEVALEQSSVAPSVAGNVARVGPTIRKRTLAGTVYLANGETAVIGGLTSPRMVKGRTSVPFLGDIPAVGWLFSTTRERETSVHLMMAVSANVLKSHEEDQLETIRRRTAFERSLSDLAGLRAITDSPYALLVSTHRSRARAEADVADFAESSYRAEIVEWRYENSTRFDVYLTGFSRFGEATAASNAVRAAGWVPRVVVVDMAIPEWAPGAP